MQKNDIVLNNNKKEKMVINRAERRRYNKALDKNGWIYELEIREKEFKHLICTINYKSEKKSTIQEIVKSVTNNKPAINDMIINKDNFDLKLNLIKKGKEYNY